MTRQLERTGRHAGFILLCLVLVAAFPASARSLLYYYDFDNVSDGALVYNGVNKGTGNGMFTLKQDGTSALGYVSGGAFGSPHAFYSSTATSLWLGDGSTSLGCGTTRGFTISF